MKKISVKLFNLLPLLNIKFKNLSGGGDIYTRFYVKLFNIIPILRVKYSCDEKNETTDINDISKINDAIVKLNGNIRFFDNNKRLLELNITNDTVAVMELCWHGEVFPSVVNYFLKLDYKVHLFLCSDASERIRNFKPMTRCNFKNVETFYFPKSFYNRLFEDGLFLSNYRVIFIATLFASAPIPKICEPFDKITTYLSKYRNNIFVINHHSGLEMKKIADYFKGGEDRIFLIRPNKKLPYCVCSYFGTIKHSTKNRITRFVCSGGIWSSRKLRNFELFFKTIKELIDNNYINFKIYFCGVDWKNIEQFDIESLKDYIIATGEINFNDYYSIVENSDFICWNIDNTCDDYEKYLSCSTGTFGLALGFNKPSLIEERLAKTYEYDETNTLLYDTNLKGTLYETMKRAIEMSNLEYEKMVNEIIKLRERLENESLDNIRKITEREKW